MSGVPDLRCSSEEAREALRASILALSTPTAAAAAALREFGEEWAATGARRLGDLIRAASLEGGESSGISLGELFPPPNRQNRAARRASRFKLR